jgi:hypothetical protein
MFEEKEPDPVLSEKPDPVKLVPDSQNCLRVSLTRLHLQNKGGKENRRHLGQPELRPAWPAWRRRERTCAGMFPAACS